ncbi:hypothetical protein [Marinobacter sp. CA1]|uniref:hypothetical protein n=1 Tax=Marinobacter sp. CA1 TaxID=2817656 RepID=UPI001D08CA91|nr:hypothetical protein [Marinobacter sp. CA1]UDL04772.1 hypothetical protein J2887_19250 [Marinobacter sp. CA1]
MEGKINFVRPGDLYVPEGNTVGAKTIANWLGNDIQYSCSSLEEWMVVFSEIGDGRREGGYLGTGNSHSVMAVSNVIYIECEYNESRKVLMTIAQATCALQEYKEFLGSDCKSRLDKIDHFHIEYEAEGDAALEQYLEMGGEFG